MATKYNIPEGNIIEGVKISTLPTVAAEILDRETIMF